LTLPLQLLKTVVVHSASTEQPGTFPSMMSWPNRMPPAMASSNVLNVGARGDELLAPLTGAVPGKVDLQRPLQGVAPLLRRRPN
jgi:hypothetical protein